jgi:hypothetical protein
MYQEGGGQKVCKAAQLSHVGAYQSRPASVWCCMVVCLPDGWYIVLRTCGS